MMATNQGGAAVSDGFNWMPAPEQVSLDNCPGGFEYLLQLDGFIVSRFIDRSRGKRTHNSYL